MLLLVRMSNAQVRKQQQHLRHAAEARSGPYAAPWSGADCTADLVQQGWDLRPQAAADPQGSSGFWLSPYAGWQALLLLLLELLCLLTWLCWAVHVELSEQCPQA